MISKKMLILIGVLFLIYSCEDEPEFPIVFEFEKDEEVGSSIVTIDDQATLIYVNQLHALGVEICDAFEFFASESVLQSVTILSETELEVTYTPPSGEEVTVSSTYSESDFYLIEEFALEWDKNENTLTSTICGQFNFAPSVPNFDAELNYCEVTTPAFFIADKFVSGGFTVGDTLGVCVLHRIYRKK